MIEVEKNLREVLATLPDNVNLVAVSKFHPADVVRRLYDIGQRSFGESRVQELVAKRESLPADIKWHFIGHLQQNKVKYIAPFVHSIDSVDTEKLLLEINRRAVAAGRRIDCLIQLHVAQEDTKFGFTPDEALRLLEEGTWRSLEGVRLRGIMCMASHTDDPARVESDFRTALHCFETARSRFFADSSDFNVRSWGMSDDYPTAIRCGSNQVRIGTHIFGEREY